MPSVIHPRTASMLALAEGIELLARALVREANKRAKAGRARPRRGATLRPGDDTPLWKALVGLVQPHLKQRGAKAVLARELGLHPARMTEFFGEQSAMPDAERALRLLVWVSERQRVNEAAVKKG